MAVEKEVVAKKGMHYSSVFATPGVAPEAQITWARYTAEIKDAKGGVVFRQEDVEFPDFFSQLAVNVVASKYFYGDVAAGNGDPKDGQREYSLRQLVGRVSATIAGWGFDDGYFIDLASKRAFEQDLKYLLLNQYGAFNSPVWFNVGLWDRYQVRGDYDGFYWSKAAGLPPGPMPVEPGKAYVFPQASACFLVGVEDSIASIYERATVEGRIFKYGSGAGSNNSAIRSSRETVRGGGRPSGPLSFMQVYDAVAKVTRSGGINRRSAKLEALNASHPDILEFIEVKEKEEAKAHALIAQSYPADFNGEAYSTVCFQNSNLSVRVSDAFMAKAAGDDPDPTWQTIAVTTGTGENLRGEAMPVYDAKTLMRRIAEGTWRCGDPGLLFDDTINSWNPVSTTHRINAVNPCGEYNYVDDSACNLASLNLLKFLRGDNTFDVDAFRAAVRVFIIAQDILVDRAGYPTAKICRNSHEHRPLGLGYANLGALIMSSGLPYDSDAGRSLAGAVTALMHGQAVLTSVDLATCHGPFAAYAANRARVLGVVRKHYDALRDPNDVTLQFRDLWIVARQVWDTAMARVPTSGLRNGQLTLLAPTGCATPDTLVLTDRGLRRLGTLGNRDGSQWQDVDFRVQTHEGPQQATRFYINGQADVIEMETKRGYRFAATPGHRLKVVDRSGAWVWRRMADLAEDDVVPIRLGGMIGDPVAVDLPALEALDPRATPIVVPTRMTADLAELVGAFMANGSLHEKGIRVSVFRHDAVLVQRTHDLFRSLFDLQAYTDDVDAGAVAVCVNSVPLRRWWQACGFAKRKPTAEHTGKGYKAHVPDAVLATNDPGVYAAFLRGVADHDGTVAEGCPEWQSSSRDFIADIKVMALALGLPTTLRFTISGKSGRPMWRARLLHRQFASEWSAMIGFTEPRKADAVAVYATTSRNDLVYLPRSVLDRVCPIGHDARHSATVCVSRTRAISRTLAAVLYRETEDTELGHYLGYFYDRVAATRFSAQQMPTYDLSVPENVTWTGGGFVSHNTIAFAMDVQTTGVEPDLALVKYKSLAGGGVLKLVNTAVPRALRTLGYGVYEDVCNGDRDVIDQVKIITDWIDRYDTIEGCHSLRPEHLPVFDCAFPPPGGGRSIHWKGHVDMMAAVQPFLSSGISKTINMPADSTVEDIEQAYIDGWRKGLKAMAIYRDGSKGSQPVTTKKEEKDGVAPAGAPDAAAPVAARDTVVGDPAPAAGGDVPADGTRLSPAEAPARHGVSYGPKAVVRMPDVDHPGMTEPGTVIPVKERSHVVEVLAPGVKLVGEGLQETMRAFQAFEAEATSLGVDLVELATRRLLEQSAAAPATPAADDHRCSPCRERLPETRMSLTHKFDIQGHEGYFTVGLYPDGRPGELFIKMAKEGSTIGGLMDVLGTAVSVGLQYGVPLEVLVRKFEHQRFEPSGMTRHRDIPFAKSIVDYIFRWMGMQFLPGYREANAPQRDEEPAPSPAPEPAKPAAKVADAVGSDILPKATPEPSKVRLDPAKLNAFVRTAIREEAALSRDPRTSILTIPPIDAKPRGVQSDAPACDNCGAITFRCGTCYRCANCGNSLGCS